MKDPTAVSPGASFSRFVACVRRKDAADAIRDRLGALADADTLEILECQNLRGVQQADTILLACQPHMYQAIITNEPGMREALSGKLIISVLAGVTPPQIEAVLGEGKYSVIRTMPNIACFVRDSATVIEKPRGEFPDSLLQITDNVFRCIGGVFYIQSPVFDVCTALCGSTPAFFAAMTSALVDGAVAMGLNHMDALQMAAHTMRGTANLLLEGRDPWTVRHQVASPGGSTMQGLLALEKGNARWTISNALIVATNEARKLGTKYPEQ